MKGQLPDGGFETPMTMSMLIISVTLLISVSSYLIGDEREYKDDDLIRLQAEQTGICILRMKEIEDTLNDDPLPEGGGSTWILMDGSISHYGSNSTFDTIISGVLRWIADVEWCVISILPDSSEAAFPDNCCCWEYGFLGGESLLVIMPVRRDIRPEGEVFR